MVIADGTCISNPCWNYVQGIDETKAIIFDLFPGTGLLCTGYFWGNFTNTCLTLSAVNVSVENIDVHPHDSGSPTVICDPSALAPGEQSTLGFLCKTGPYVATEIGSSSGGIKVAETKMVVLGLTGALGLALLL